MKAYKTEIYLNPKQLHTFANTAGVCRFLYNAFIDYNQKLYEKERTFCSGMNFDKHVNNKLAIENPWIKEVSSKARKKAIMNADTAFRRFFKGESRFPRFKKKNRQDVKVYFPKNNATDLTVERHRIKVPTFGWIVLKEKGYVPADAEVSSCTMEQKAGKFFISVLVKNAVPAPKPVLRSDGMGIDLGLKEFAMTSDGQLFKNINKSRRIKQLERKLKREQRSLSRKYEYYKKIKNQKKQEKPNETMNQRKNLHKNIRRVQILHLRLTNIRNAYQDYVIREVAKTKPSFIALENLNVRGMIKNKHLSKAISNQKFYEFKLKLKNKCQKLGIELREVDRFYPSSKLCSSCGEKKVALSLSERLFTCAPCGYKMDRDKNAAVNLKQAKKYTILT